jgi:hypothetical protein
MNINVRKSKQPVFHVMNQKHIVEKAIAKDGFYEVTDNETKRNFKITWDENMHLIEYFGEYQTIGTILSKHNLSLNQIEKGFSIYQKSYKDKTTAKKWDITTSSLAAENLLHHFEESEIYNLSGCVNSDFHEITKFFRLKIAISINKTPFEK